MPAVQGNLLQAMRSRTAVRSGIVDIHYGKRLRNGVLSGWEERLLIRGKKLRENHLLAREFGSFRRTGEGIA